MEGMLLSFVAAHAALNRQKVSVDPQRCTSNRHQEVLPRIYGIKPVDGEFCAEEERKTRTADGTSYSNTHREEEQAVVGGIVDDGYYRNSQGDIAEAIRFVALLKDCANPKDLSRGITIHADIVRKKLLETNVYIGNSLVNMYAKCGAFEKAKEVFDQIPTPDIVSWNVLIAAHIQHGHSEEALVFFEQMQLQSFAPNGVTFVCLLKACSDIGAIDRGQGIHAQVIKEGWLEKDDHVGTALVGMYAKYGSLGKAREVFDELPVHNVVSWTALIMGYAEYGDGVKALTCFEQMQREGLTPDVVTLACILKVCGMIGVPLKGQEIHAKVVREGLLETSILVGNALVDMYAKCGLLEEAKDVFNGLRVRDAILWNALIAGFVQCKLCEDALEYFECMQLEGFSPNEETFSCILEACGILEAVGRGQEIHAELVRDGLLEENVIVGTALVGMYGNCCMLEDARKVFNDLPVKDAVSWTNMIMHYAQQGHGEETVKCFEQMQLRGFSPNIVCYVWTLKACGTIGASDKGAEIHAQIVRHEFLQKDTCIGSALVDMYAKCGLLSKAQEAFDNLSVKNTISWTALISGYAQHGHGEEALTCFEQMQHKGFSPDLVTFSCVLKACGSIGVLDRGRDIHAKIVREGLVERDIVVTNALLDMYAKCGLLRKLQEVFEELQVRDVVSWNVLIMGFAHHNRDEEALRWFDLMQLQGFSPNAVTFGCILKACGSMGSLCEGQNLHANIVRNGLLENDAVIGTALVDMYSNCGMPAEAHAMFDSLPVQNVASWNSLLVGYAQLGKPEMVFTLHEKMITEGNEPNLATFTILLSTCSHRGLLEKGQMYFKVISNGCGIVPALEHHTCLIDLFGRAGLLDEATVVIEEMPFPANLTVWHAFLGACQKWGNMNLGTFAFVHAAQLDERNSAHLVSMSNIYAVDCGWWQTREAQVEIKERRMWS